MDYLAPDAIERVLSQAEKSRQDTINLLRKLISYRTESQNPDNPDYLPQARACQDFISGFLKENGFAIDAWDATPLTFPGHPTIAASRKGTGGGRSVALNGHIDVVPAGGTSAWTVDPWAGEIKDGKLYGRGAADMKAGVASMLAAVKLLGDAGFRLKGDVLVHSVSDEEVVGFGTRECVERSPKMGAVICTEPSGLEIFPAEPGLEHVRIEVDGLETHAGNRYACIHAGGNAPGVNAIEKTIKLITAIQELERMWANKKSHPLLPAGFDTLLPGLIMGGPGGGKDGKLNMITNPGTVPGYCSVEYNIWYYPSETRDQIIRDFEGYVLDVAKCDDWLKDHPPRFTWNLRNVSFPPFDTQPDSPLIQTLVRSLGEVAVQPKISAFRAASDLAWYGEKGGSGAIFGPGRINECHSPNEFVEVEELISATKVLALTILNWCGFK
ncbi:MAG: ArgE/DapE family deacylase [Chloroflexi bacterium]|nr:ArgE/DapE family deacylase [Chloroflexota bacterium]